MATDPVDVSSAVTEMVVNRFVDNAAAAAASLSRPPVAAARAQALAHPPSTGGPGAAVFGLPAKVTVSPEWDRPVPAGSTLYYVARERLGAERLFAGT